MDNSPNKKNCWLCKHAPIIALAFADFVAALLGYAFDPLWVAIEVLYAFSFVSKAKTMSDFVANKALTPYGIMLCYIVSILIRTTIALLLVVFHTQG